MWLMEWLEEMGGKHKAHILNKTEGIEKKCVNT